MAESCMYMVRRRAIKIHHKINKLWTFQSVLSDVSMRDWHIYNRAAAARSWRDSIYETRTRDHKEFNWFVSGTRFSPIMRYTFDKQPRTHPRRRVQK